MSVSLVNYDDGRRRLKLARSHDEVKDIRDKAQALATYARLAKDSELLGWVSEIKIRAERRAGELIGEQQKNGKLAKQGGDRKSKSQPATLKSQEITPSDSSRWQKMAKLDEAKFEQAIASAQDQLGEVTTAFVLRAAAANSEAKPRKRKASVAVAERSNRDGQLARFYTVVRGCSDIMALGLTPKQWLQDAPEELHHAIGPAVVPAQKWLTKLLGGLK